jgi:subfamily B ATP-binding cassette protein MsbA
MDQPHSARRDGSVALLRRLLVECRPDVRRLLLTVLTLLGLGASQLALPWLIKQWVEGPLVRGEIEIGRHLVAAVVIAGLIALFLLTSRTLLAQVNQRLLERLRSRAVDRLLRLEPVTVQGYTAGDLMSRVFQDAGFLSGFINAMLKRVLGDGLIAAGALAMMFVLDPVLALAAVVVAPALGAVFIAIGSVVRRLGAVAQRSMGELSATLHQQLEGFTTVKGYGAEAYESRRYADCNRRYRRQVVRAEAWTAGLVAAVFVLATAAFVLAIAFGTQRVASGAITAGGLLAFCLYAGQTIEPVRRLAETHGMLQRAFAAAERLFELIDLPLGEDGPAPVERPALRTASGGYAVRFEALSFAYRADRPVLDDLSLEIRPGHPTALVAASGGGKTTIASLLQRFREPSAGTIMLDGVSLGAYPLDQLRQQICVVEQRPFLLSGPLRDSIVYGSWSASGEAVEEAVRLTGLDPLVAELPRGLDQPVEETGRDLSGGQRQRIALARAIVRDPAVLVLDEATSALDSDSEASLFLALEAWLRRRTVLVMAHRLSTVCHLPRVIVMEGGRAVAEGTVEQLTLSSAVFRTLFGDQLDSRVGVAAQ